jgi:hypothetical protein
MWAPFVANYRVPFALRATLPVTLHYSVKRSERRSGQAASAISPSRTAFGRAPPRAQRVGARRGSETVSVWEIASATS